MSESEVQSYNIDLTFNFKMFFILIINQYLSNNVMETQNLTSRLHNGGRSSSRGLRKSDSNGSVVLENNTFNKSQDSEGS